MLKKLGRKHPYPFPKKHPLQNEKKNMFYSSLYIFYVYCKLIYRLEKVLEHQKCELKRLTDETKRNLQNTCGKQDCNFTAVIQKNSNLQDSCKQNTALYPMISSHNKNMVRQTLCLLKKNQLIILCYKFKILQRFGKSSSNQLLSLISINTYIRPTVQTCKNIGISNAVFC